LTNIELIKRGSRAVLLKRVPLGSRKEEFLIRGRIFVPGTYWGGKAVYEKTLSSYVYSTHKKLHNKLV